MSKPLILIGAGGHARVVLELAQVLGKTVLGITDENYTKLPSSIFGVPLLGTDQVLESHHPKDVELINGIGSTGNPSIRVRIFETYLKKGFSFPHLIHPSAFVAKTVRLEQGVQVFAGSIVQTGSKIQRNVILNTGCIVDHDCEINEHAHIAPGAVLCGEVKIGKKTHIGAGATVLQGIHVGGEVLVGAGSVVTRDLSNGQRAKGVPARVQQNLSPGDPPLSC